VATHLQSYRPANPGDALSVAPPQADPTNAAAPKLSLAVAAGVACAAGLAVWALARKSSGGDQLRQVLSAPAPDAAGLRLIRDALVGVSRPGVAALLGAPQAAATGGKLVLDPGSGDRAAADVWYYPMSGRQGALGVRFNRHQAVEAEFFRKPIP
jgi:hypothetical protein